MGGGVGMIAGGARTAKEPLHDQWLTRSITSTLPTYLPTYLPTTEQPGGSARKGGMGGIT